MPLTLSPGPSTLPLFDHVNARVYADPRVRIHEADGRHFLGQAHAPFGVVTLEPPPPRAAGAASLYTQELYQRARAHMTAHGVIAQWLPLHGLGDAELAIIARTFQRVFPDMALFMLNENEAALLGSPAGLSFDLHRLVARLDEPRVSVGLRNIGFDAVSAQARAAQLLSLAVASGPSLARALGSGGVISDDLPLVEQFAVSLSAGDAGDEGAQKRRFLQRLLGAQASSVPVLGPALPALADERLAMHARLSRWAEPSAPRPR